MLRNLCSNRCCSRLAEFSGRLIILTYNTIKLQLKKLEALCELYPKDILRCHRFFWVNPLRVEKVEGNARGLQLKMPSIPEPVPVSKTYLMDVKDWFKKGIG